MTDELAQNVEEVQEIAEPLVKTEEKKGAFTKLTEWKNWIQSFIVECKRVLIITKKPNKEEFKTIVKISGFGILIIGLIGFIIHLFKEMLF